VANIWKTSIGELLGQLEEQIGTTRIQARVQEPPRLLTAQHTLGIHLIDRASDHRRFWCDIRDR
jgi:hypothetical protein